MKRPPRTECGATFVEAVVAILILSAACGGAYRAARAVLVAAGSVRRLAADDRSLVRANALLRQSTSRIRYPPRAATLEVDSRDGYLRLWYLDGDVRRHLELSFRGRQLVVSDGLTVERIGEFASVSLDFLYSGVSLHSGTPVPVVHVRFVSAGGEHVSIFARVGSWPLLPARLQAGRRW